MEYKYTPLAAHPPPRPQPPARSKKKLLEEIVFLDLQSAESVGENEIDRSSCVLWKKRVTYTGTVRYPVYGTELDDALDRLRTSPTSVIIHQHGLVRLHCEALWCARPSWFLTQVKLEALLPSSGSCWTSVPGLRHHIGDDIHLT
ncbi:hypothetical protein EVAR_65483_1 [Eumeta japonica]|uniref:Uncharacterized protein n=1 Tax=Eumeta variegata TaxID=151549 RepID=A0A4C2A829_EUMVA|nr:hypothetical protein EVAR_65483_1 [Eumeta japonica]